MEYGGSGDPPLRGSWNRWIVSPVHGGRVRSTCREALQASPTGQAVRDFSRLFYARAQRVELDRQGRIRIPPELAPLIGLPRGDGSAAEGVLVGVRDHVELWEAGRWQAYLQQRQDQYDQLAEQAFA